MTIRIYASREAQSPSEAHEWAGTVGDFMRWRGVDYTTHTVQRVVVYVNGALLKSDLWEGVRVDLHDSVDVYVQPFGFIGKAISKVFNAAFGWMLPKVSAPTRVDTTQGKTLDSSSAQANRARLNEVVPETFGRIARFPNYLAHPVQRFENERTQTLEMLLCIGPGQYITDEPKIGNTPIGQMAGASYRVYAPGADLTGISAAENWYPAPEVGSTSGGGAGLELTAAAASGLAPTGSSFALSGAQITSADAPFPDSWTVGTTMELLFSQAATITRVDINEDPLLDPVWVNELAGDWSELTPAINMLLRCSGVFTGEARIAHIDGNVIRLQEFIDDEWVYIENLPTGAQKIAVSEDGRVYRVATKATNTVTLDTPFVSGWAGFAARTVDAADAQWFVNGSDIQGEAAGPFVILPPSEKTQSFEIDLFFPRGLHSDGDKNQTVTVEISYRDASQITPQPWTTIAKVYTAATLDQIGFTERIDTPTRIRPEVLVRRTTAKSTSSNVADEMQWYGARCLLETPSSYPWTTLAVSIRGLGKISSSSESRVSVVVQRVLPTLLENGTWSEPVPTRDISAAFWYICTQVGYGVDSIDMAELQRLHEIWKARGETFDATLDEMTAQDAIETIFAAGMAQLTVENGKLLPVREGPRYVPEQVYSAQNTTREIVRQFSAHRTDDKDGVEVEYQDARTGWATETIKCVLPDSPGLKLETIKLVGVTDRNRAWRIGMRRAREMRYQRWSYSFSTELDALNSTYGGFVSLVGDQSALLKNVAPAQYGRTMLTVSEPLRWKSGEQHSVAIRHPDGSLAGPFQAFQGANANEVAAVIPTADIPVVTMRQELPHVYFGPDQGWRWNAIVRSVRPAANDTCTVQAVNYDQRVYSDDDFGPDSLVLTSLEYLPQWETSDVYAQEWLTSQLYGLEPFTDSMAVGVIGIGASLKDVLVPYEMVTEVISANPTLIGASLAPRGYAYTELIDSTPTTIGASLRSTRYAYTEAVQSLPETVGVKMYDANTDMSPEYISASPETIGATLY